MGWVFLEVMGVLAIAVGIVWWTLPKRPRDQAEDRPGGEPGRGDGESPPRG